MFRGSTVFAIICQIQQYYYVLTSSSEDQILKVPLSLSLSLSLHCRPKHPVKVHVWAGISWQGATSCCIFDGIMNAPLFVKIVEQTLVPFLKERLPRHHRFMQDNDPKHTSKMAQEYFVNNGINWWKTPPESPDLNPLENMWHELKEFIRREVKPHNKFKE